MQWDYSVIGLTVMI